MEIPCYVVGLAFDFHLISFDITRNLLGSPEFRQDANVSQIEIDKLVMAEKKKSKTKQRKSNSAI